MADTVAIHVPQALYGRLERLAELTLRPLASLVEQTLSSDLPPLPEVLSEPMREAVVALEGLRDDEHVGVMESTSNEGQQARFDRLGDKERAGTLTEEERAAVEPLWREADLMLLRKAYAAVLLKWRGYVLPTLQELEARV